MARSPLQLADLVALLTIAEGGWGIRLPITNFMENGQAQYNWLNDFDYRVAISKGQHNADTKRS